MPDPCTTPVDGLHQVVPEENEVVENGDNGQQGHGKHPIGQIGQDLIDKQGGIQQGQPFDADGNEKCGQHLQIGVEGGVGEEHGQVEVLHIGGDGGLIHGIDERQKQAHKNVQEHAQAVVDGEAGGAPGVLQP